MGKLPITFACGPYDRMEALKTGVIEVEGVDLNYLAIKTPREVFDRMVGGLEFDASELSAAEFITQTGQGDCPFVALPVFPSKAFRHGFICINSKAGIDRPKDLEGKRVGLPMYTQTAAIYLRGLLQHEYGVNLDKVHWVQGAVERAGVHGSPQTRPLLKPVDIEINTSGRSLGDLLATGEIDAMLGSRLPQTLGRHPDVTRLFPNYGEIERAYYRKTRIHPIMHLVAIRKDVHEAHPWLANSLYKALNASKNWALKQMRFSAAQRYMLPWLYADLDEIDALFGGDPWPYGVEANRPTLEALMQYMVEQHFIAEAIPLEELFAPVRFR